MPTEDWDIEDIDMIEPERFEVDGNKVESDLTKEDLEELIESSNVGNYDLIEDEFLEEVRWGYRNQVVFKDRHTDAHFGFTYEIGAGDSEYDFEPSKVYPVERKEVTTIIWERVNE